MSRSKAEREALSRVRALAQSITESEENANDLVDLLEYLHVSSEAREQIQRMFNL